MVAGNGRLEMKFSSKVVKIVSWIQYPVPRPHSVSVSLSLAHSSILQLIKVIIFQVLMKSTTKMCMPEEENVSLTRMSKRKG